MFALGLKGTLSRDVEGAKKRDATGIYMTDIKKGM